MRCQSCQVIRGRRIGMVAGRFGVQVVAPSAHLILRGICEASEVDSGISGWPVLTRRKDALN